MCDTGGAITSYRIELREGTGDFSTVSTVTADVLSFTITDLSVQTTYE